MLSGRSSLKTTAHDRIGDGVQHVGHDVAEPLRRASAKKSALAWCHVARCFAANSVAQRSAVTRNSRSISA